MCPGKNSSHEMLVSFLKIHKIYFTTMHKWWKSDKKKWKNSGKEKNTCFKYRELQSTKFIFIGELPVWYLEVSLFSINYFVISTAVALIITKYHGQSSSRLGHKNWNKWGFIAPWEQHAFWMISDWKIRKCCIFKTLITSLKIKRFSWKWSH